MARGYWHLDGGFGPAAWLALNAWSALFVFLGIFLRHRPQLAQNSNSTSSSALSRLLGLDKPRRPQLGAVPLYLALVLFFWTPPHFWSFAIAFSDDYAAAGVPMLPVVIGDKRAAKVIFISTLALVAASFLPLFFGLGMIYGAGAAIGGYLFIQKAWRLSQDTNRQSAMTCFHASLIQLTLVLLGAILDAQF
jgi:protoheme IX farnesyltransferase